MCQGRTAKAPPSTSWPLTCASACRVSSDATTDRGHLKRATPPVLSFRDIDRALGVLGFAPACQRGSHVVYRHPDGRTTTTVPRHDGRDVAPPLLRKIMDDIGVSAEAFPDALRS